MDIFDHVLSSRLIMKDIKIHDFEKSKKYNPSQIKFLTSYSEAFSKSSSLQLKYELKNKSNMKMILKEVYQEPYGEFLEKMDYDTVIVDFNIGDNANNLMFNIEKKVALIMVDCLLGSDGKVAENKDLTEIDIEIIKYISNTLFKKTRNFIDMSKTYVNDIYTNKAQYRNPSARGYTFISVIDVYLNNEVIGNIKIAVPYVSVEKVIEILMAQKNEKDIVKHISNTINSKMLETMFENCIELDVVAELGYIELTVGELLSLEPGDALALNRKITEDIGVLVGGKISYLGKPGRIGLNNAVIITDSVEGEDVENDERENE